MPKFLDVPSWYNSQGTLSYGVGVDTNEQPGVGDVPCVHLPSGELNWRHLMANGATSGDISIYAPTSTGTAGQILQSNGIMGAPSWQDFDVNGHAIGAGAYSNSIYAPGTAGSTGQILRSAGLGAPVWSDASMLFCDYQFGTSGYVSSVGGIWNATLAFMVISSTSRSASGTFCGISLGEGEGIIILNFPGVRGTTSHYIIGPDDNTVKNFAGSATYTVSSGTFKMYGFGFNF